MFCPKCGSEVKDGDMFCGECGMGTVGVRKSADRKPEDSRPE